MAEEKEVSWLRFLPLVGAVSSIIGPMAIAGMFIVSAVGRSDQTTVAFTELKAEFRSFQDKVFAKLETMPGDKIRLDQIEQRVRETGAQMGGIDARLGLLERKTDVNSAAIDGIKGASSARLRP